MKLWRHDNSFVTWICSLIASMFEILLKASSGGKNCTEAHMMSNSMYVTCVPQYNFINQASTFLATSFRSGCITPFWDSYLDAWKKEIDALADLEPKEKQNAA